MEIRETAASKRIQGIPKSAIHEMTRLSKPVFVPLVEQEGFSLDIEAVEKAVTPRTRAILFCSPSNPTGTVFSEKQLRELGRIAVERDLMIITDEAYEYFVFDDSRHFCVASIPEVRERVVS